MDSLPAKAEALYKKAEYLDLIGNTFLSEKFYKLADHVGMLYIKESYAQSKKMKKKATIEKPSKEEILHSTREGNEKSANWLNTAKNALTWGLVGGTGLAGVGYVAAPTIAARAAKAGATEATDTTMQKIKQYALPAAVAVAGLGITASNLMKGGGPTPVAAQKHTKNTKAHQVGKSPSNALRKLSSTNVLPAEKVAKLIAGFRVREGILNSNLEKKAELVDACDAYMSRLLFSKGRR